MIYITDEAAKALRAMAAENKDDTRKLTLISAGAGCGAPAVKIEMREPLQDDTPENLSGISIRVRASIKRYLEDAEIILEDTFWGRQLKVKTVYGCR